MCSAGRMLIRALDGLRLGVSQLQGLSVGVCRREEGWAEDARGTWALPASARELKPQLPR